MYLTPNTPPTATARGPVLANAKLPVDAATPKPPAIAALKPSPFYRPLTGPARYTLETAVTVGGALAVGGLLGWGGFALGMSVGSPFTAIAGAVVLMCIAGGVGGVAGGLLGNMLGRRLAGPPPFQR